MRHLLGELGVTGDLPLLAVAVMAPLEVPVLDHGDRVDEAMVERIHRGWVDLVHRIVNGGCAPPTGSGPPNERPRPPLD